VRMFGAISREPSNILRARASKGAPQIVSLYPADAWSPAESVGQGTWLPGAVRG
jgi:hypothetical protein